MYFWIGAAAILSALLQRTFCFYKILIIHEIFTHWPHDDAETQQHKSLVYHLASGCVISGLVVALVSVLEQKCPAQWTHKTVKDPQLLLPVVLRHRRAAAARKSDDLVFFLILHSYMFTSLSDVLKIKTLSFTLLLWFLFIKKNMKCVCIWN